MTNPICVVDNVEMYYDFSKMEYICPKCNTFLDKQTSSILRELDALKD